MEEMQSIQKSKSEHLEKRTVVITGASSGIGRAATIEFARRNYHVAAVARNENIGHLRRAGVICLNLIKNGLPLAEDG